MAKADSIIDALEKYFIGCELLKDGALRVDYLGKSRWNIPLRSCLADPVVKEVSRRKYRPAIPFRIRIQGILQPGTPAEHPEQCIL